MFTAAWATLVLAQGTIPMKKLLSVLVENKISQLKIASEIPPTSK